MVDWFIVYFVIFNYELIKSQISSAEFCVVWLFCNRVLSQLSLSCAWHWVGIKYVLIKWAISRMNRWVLATALMSVSIVRIEWGPKSHVATGKMDLGTVVRLSRLTPENLLWACLMFVVCHWPWRDYLHHKIKKH